MDSPLIPSMIRARTPAGNTEAGRGPIDGVIAVMDALAWLLPYGMARTVREVNPVDRLAPGHGMVRSRDNVRFFMLQKERWRTAIRQRLSSGCCRVIRIGCGTGG